jgi:hypothetical protein
MTKSDAHFLETAGGMSRILWQRGHSTVGRL